MMCSADSVKTLYDPLWTVGPKAKFWSAAVINRRTRGDRVQFWLRTSERSEVGAVADALTASLNIHPTLGYRTEFRVRLRLSEIEL